jgi:DNA gyrase subunit A
MLKKTNVEMFPGPSAKTFTAIKVAAGDSLGWVSLTFGKDELLLVSRSGMAIRFSETQIRPMGLAAAGVMGMKLESKDDRIVGMHKIVSRADVLLMSENGFAKRTGLSQFPRQGRYGKGVLAWKSGEGVVLAGTAVGNAEQRAKVIFSKSAPKSLRFGEAIRRNRASAGKSVFELGSGNRVIGIVSIVARESIPETSKPRSSSSRRATGNKSTTGKKGSTASAKKRSSARTTSLKAKTTPKRSTGSRKKTTQSKTSTRRKSSSTTKKSSSRTTKRPAKK